MDTMNKDGKADLTQFSTVKVSTNKNLTISYALFFPPNQIPNRVSEFRTHFVVHNKIEREVKCP